MPASSLSELSDRRYPQGSRTTDIRPQSRIRARSGSSGTLPFRMTMASPKHIDSEPCGPIQSRLSRTRWSLRRRCLARRVRGLSRRSIVCAAAGA